MAKRQWLLACSLASAVMSACHKEASAPAQPNQTITVAISPSRGALTQCYTVQFTAVVHDGSGGTVVPDSVKWLSKSSAGSISSSGLLTGLQPTLADTIVATAFARGLQAEAQVIFPIFQNTPGQCP